MLLILLALGLAGFGLAEWILPTKGDTIAWRSWHGPQAHAVTRDTQVATTTAEWRALWSSLRHDPPPPFNAARQTGVVILVGQRPTPGYHLDILGTEQRGERLIIVVEETRPRRDVFLPQQITSPYAIVLLEHSGARVSVEQRVRD